MTNFRGHGYIGSDKLETTSTPNTEVIPEPPSNWTNGYSLYKFAFLNNQDCTIKINGGDPIFLRANQGFNMDRIDQPIKSFVVVEEGITYNWIGAW